MNTEQRITSSPQLKTVSISMETSVKTWLLRLLVVLPVLCVIISVVLWKNKQNETVDIQMVTLKNNLEEEIRKLRDEVETIHREKRESRVEEGNAQIRQLTPGGGAVYVHWGRKDCSTTADTVYTGIAGGGYFAHKGAAVNMLCLTHNPVWAKYGNDVNHFAFLYGTEYEVASNDFPLGHDRAEKINDHDVPCSVCQSSTRTSVIMIPGTTECTEGWTAEYSGYLMAGFYDQVASTEYNCIDANPDAHESGSTSENGHLLYRVKGKCGSLPCPPYVEMREITCVVCTK